MRISKLNVAELYLNNYYNGFIYSFMKLSTMGTHYTIFVIIIQTNKMLSDSDLQDD